MKDLFCKMDFWALVVSVITMIGGAIGFLLYDRKLKKQEKELNDLTISSMEIDKIERNSANLECEIHRCTDNYQFVRVFVTNVGRSIARNIRVVLPQEQNISVVEEVRLSHDLLQVNQRYELQTLVGDDDLRILRLTIMWDDDNDVNKEKEYSLPI